MDFILILAGLFIPFAGTVFGSACVYFLRDQMKRGLRGVLCGFAAGVMTAASVWSLLIPAMEAPYTHWLPDWFPAVVGFWIGIIGLLWLDNRLQVSESGNAAIGQQDRMLVLVVTLHNLPEGMAVGAVTAGCLFGNGEVTAAAVLALAIGIGLQNFPEGAAISPPLYQRGQSRGKAFLGGFLSGTVEPIFGMAVLLAAAEARGLMPQPSFLVQAIFPLLMSSALVCPLFSRMISASVLVFCAR